ncbi:MAG: 16S rRNA (cytidine(1402)-2'-O)-methyltransferase [Sphingomonadaceae bacterium]|uniref:16S rRNA (cytidine(1402)-2'-O)-methyltransferase n=1 Tax=Thermaurantiacus sp. TaxID=2820283 RepID=UPI00298EEDE1|nr:16S rRNA (cytidine(1402)-2'-O)-methyltransferase [Thermaurantiacus sp.]MCS6986938.1 16S rRNA (cytidine(1402)-2'-O)-methyltransferase [Sphingomonadaceae bacterium]MDW8415462.1 16S rRNA (cytidine(1402)-2'-O)-methyltransferase [Thermaurantiacus sp.]
MPDEAVDVPLAPGLYIVATPIGNLADLSLRAADWLRRADLVACEDTRVTRTLLRHVGSDRPLWSFHDHSPSSRHERLLDAMARRSVALVSDAGTPLISDPGYGLVREARRRGIPVTTAPGPCAAIAALSIAGLPTDRFFFAGFLPARPTARDAAIGDLARIPGTLILHETAPRLTATLEALARILGDREAAVARELTKRHEEVVTGPLSTLVRRFAAHPPKGELVVLVAPPPRDGALLRPAPEEVDRALRQALSTLPPGKAAARVAQAFGLPREEAFARALALAQGDA